MFRFKHGKKLKQILAQKVFFFWLDPPVEQDTNKAIFQFLMQKQDWMLECPLFRRNNSSETTEFRI